jgi:ABC-type sugar transport system substrate-binding protein
MLVLSAEGWDQAIAAAKKKKIGVFNHSASAISGCTQNVGLDQRAGGRGPGAYAAQWINKNHGGKASVGVLGILNDPQLKLRSEGFKEALAQFAPNTQVVGEVHAQTRDVGASAAANLLQAHPDIKVIYAAGDDPGLGALTAATEAGKTNAKDFFIGSSDGTDAVFEKIAEGGIYQCTWSFLFPFSATQFERDIERFLRGKPVRPTRIMIGQLATSTNLNAVKQLVSDPRAPGVQWVYKRRMKYSDYRLKTNEPFLNAFA